MKAAIRRVLVLLVMAPAALAMLAPAASAAPGTVGYQHESLAQFEAQLKGGRIHEATINKRLRSVRLSLTSSNVSGSQPCALDWISARSKRIKSRASRG